MHISKSSGIEELIQKSDDATVEPVYEPSAPGRKRDRKPVKVQASQAWRTLEDRLNERSLRHKLKEIYED
jgi:hypothetical protein